MKVQIFSWSKSRGGAARAADRLFNAIKAFESNEIDIGMYVNDKELDSIGLISPKSNLRYGWNLIRRFGGIKIQEFQSTPNQLLHSSALIPSSLDKYINRNDFDLINLHWVQGEMLSIKSIGRIKKPIIFTLHDSWAFLGSEHHPNGDNDYRYIEGYFRSNKPSRNHGIDIDRISWQLKKKYWREKLQVVCPSNWLADCARKSNLMRDWPITVIPNPVPVERFKPINKALARKIFNLDLKKNYILFGAINATSDFNKGWDLLEPALKELSQSLPNLEAVIIGGNEPIEEPKIGMKINYFGHLYDDYTLSAIFSAVDVVVVPSRIETLCQIATEAQSCGTPVIAFGCCGLLDIIIHKKTGFLAKAFDIRSLINGVIWILKDKENLKKISLK